MSNNAGPVGPLEDLIAELEYQERRLAEDQCFSVERHRRVLAEALLAWFESRAALNATQAAAPPCATCGSATCEGTHMVSGERDYAANEAWLRDRLGPHAPQAAAPEPERCPLHRPEPARCDDYLGDYGDSNGPARCELARGHKGPCVHVPWTEPAPAAPPVLAYTNKTESYRTAAERISPTPRLPDDDMPAPAAQPWSWTAEDEKSLAYFESASASTKIIAAKLRSALAHIEAQRVEIERLQAERERWLASAHEHISLTERAQAREAVALNEVAVLRAAMKLT